VPERLCDAPCGQAIKGAISSSTLRYWEESELEELCGSCGLVEYSRIRRNQFIMISAKRALDSQASFFLVCIAKVVKNEFPDVRYLCELSSCYYTMRYTFVGLNLFTSTLCLQCVLITCSYPSERQNRSNLLYRHISDLPPKKPL
jgi:hypothetical protein